MAEYIDRDLLLDCCANHKGNTIDPNDIMRLPTANVAPVVHGEWITIEDDWADEYYFECSVCHRKFAIIDGTPQENGYHYCPGCGARMEGVECD